jgi:hypothetical protein
MRGSMDGLALAEEVHRRWPLILLVLSSGDARLRPEEIPDHGQFVPKPYVVASVVRHIHDLIHNVSSGTGTPNL